MENVKVSYCQKCNGWVRRAALEEMDEEDKIMLAMEAFKYDLRISTISRQEYENDTTERCKCK